MSGGSFDYVQYDDVETLLGPSCLVLEELVKWCKEEGYETIASNTQGAIKRIEKIQELIHDLETLLDDEQNPYSLRYAWAMCDKSISGDVSRQKLAIAEVKQKGYSFMWEEREN